MENWRVIPSSAVDDYTIAIICTSARYVSFARDIAKIFTVISKYNGDYRKDFVNSDIAIVIVSFENETDYINFQKDFENLKAR